jgi:cell division initiation protein
MAIKPIDVRRKEFKRGFRGYNADQVDDFLDTVADEFERSYSENLRMREEISNLRERLEQFEKLEDSIQSALVHAEQAANDLRDSAAAEAENLRNNANRQAENVRHNANREAELTLKDARERAQQMLADSSSKVERAQESYEALKKAKQDFSADFRHLLKSYLVVMDNVDLSSAKEIEASLRERLDWEAIAAAREAAEREQAENESPDRSPGPEEGAEPESEVEEAEVEPSSVEDAGEQAVAVDTEAVAEVDREDEPPATDAEADGRQGRDEATEEDDTDRRSRASRFLRRLG